MAHFFRDIDSRRAELGIQDVQLQMSTLEDVFLRIAQDCEVEEARASNKLTNINIELESLRKRIETAIYRKAVLKQSLENIQEIVIKQEEKLKADKELFNNFNVKDWQDISDFTKQNRDALDKRMMLLEKLVGSDNQDEEIKDTILSKHKRCEKERYLIDYFDKKEKELLESG